MNRTQLHVVTTRVARGMVVLAATLSGFAVTSQAHAQWGYGFWALNPNDGSQITEGLNQRAALNGQAALAARQNIAPAVPRFQTRSDYARDTEFVERIGISTRRGTQSRAAAPPSTTRPAAAPASTGTRAPAATPAPAKPIVSLAGFFSPANVLVWPADAPMSGDLYPKRVASDKASLKVYDEVKASGIATVSSVTNARTLLVEYGNPALQYLRAHTTTQVSDSFHLFLLSLYEALAQAGNPPIPPAPKR